MRSFDLVSAELVAFKLLALLFPLVLLAALFFVVRTAVRSGMSRAMMSGAQGSAASAKETLDRRYASGEITREEYLNVRDDMKRDGDA